MKKIIRYFKDIYFNKNEQKKQFIFQELFTDNKTEESIYLFEDARNLFENELKERLDYHKKEVETIEAYFNESLTQKK